MNLLRITNFLFIDFNKRLWKAGRIVLNTFTTLYQFIKEVAEFNTLLLVGIRSLIVDFTTQYKDFAIISKYWVFFNVNKVIASVVRGPKHNTNCFESFLLLLLLLLQFPFLPALQPLTVNLGLDKEGIRFGTIICNSS